MLQGRLHGEENNFAKWILQRLPSILDSIQWWVKVRQRCLWQRRKKYPIRGWIMFEVRSIHKSNCERRQSNMWHGAMCWKSCDSRRWKLSRLRGLWETFSFCVQRIHSLWMQKWMWWKAVCYHSWWMYWLSTLFKRLKWLDHMRSWWLWWKPIRWSGWYVLKLWNLFTPFWR